MAALGHGRYDIAKTFNVSERIVGNILHGINETTKQELGSMLTDRIPLEFKKSLILLDFLMKRAVEIEQGSKDERVKLQALGLIKDINESKNKLLVDSTIIHNAIENSSIPIIQESSSKKKEVNDDDTSIVVKQQE